MKSVKTLITAAAIASILGSASSSAALAGNPFTQMGGGNHGNPLYGAEGPGENIQPNGVIQGNIGDCDFLAAVASLAKINPKAIQEMIKDNGNGTYTVTFPGHVNDPIIVSAPTPDELKEFARGSGYGYWAPVLEKAYGKYCSESIWRRNPLSPESFLFGGSMTHEAADGGSVLNDGLKMLSSDHDVTSDTLGVTMYSTLMIHMSNAIDNKCPMTCGTTAFSNHLNLPTNHACAVIGFEPNWDNPKESLVTIYNPHGDVKDAGPNGSSCGTFRLTLKDFCDVFFSVAYATGPVKTADDFKKPVTPVANNYTPPVAPPSEVIQDKGYTPLTRSRVKSVGKDDEGVRTVELTDGTTMIEDGKGYEHIKYADGQEVERIPGVSRTFVTFINDQLVKEVFLEDGTHTYYWPDGSKSTDLPNGTHILQMADGTIITTAANGVKTVTHPSKSTAMLTEVPNPASALASYYVPQMDVDSERSSVAHGVRRLGQGLGSLLMNTVGACDVVYGVAPMPVCDGMPYDMYWGSAPYAAMPCPGMSCGVPYATAPYGTVSRMVMSGRRMAR